MKTLFKGVAAVGGTLAVSQIVLKKVSKRSMRSQLIEWMLDLKINHPNYEDDDSKHEFVNALYDMNKEEFKLPKMYKPKTHMEEYFIDEMKVLKHNVKAPSNIGILYLHGGAYIYQPSIFHHYFIDELSLKVNATVEMPVYPKAPNDIFIRSYELIIDLYRRMVETYDDVIIIGDSAGGGLAAGLIQLLKERAVKQPLHVFLLSPWIDINMDNDKITKDLLESDPMLTIESLKFAGDLWSGHTDKNHYLLSPIYGDLHGLPPITIFVGTREILLPDIQLFSDKLQAFNNNVAYHEYVNQNHVFLLEPIPEAKDARSIIYNTINRYKGKNV